MYKVECTRCGKSGCGKGIWIIRSPDGVDLGKSFTSKMDADWTCMVLNQARKQAFIDATQEKL